MADAIDKRITFQSAADGLANVHFLFYFSSLAEAPRSLDEEKHGIVVWSVGPSDASKRK